MAIQILPSNPSLGTSLGQALGGGLGRGLASGMDALMQHKFNQLQNRLQAQQLTPALIALGLPQDKAQAVAMLPPKLQELYLQNYQQVVPQGVFQGPESVPNFEEMLQGAAQQEQPEPLQMQQRKPSIEQLLAGPGSQFAKLSPDVQNQINALIGQQAIQPAQQPQPQPQPQQIQQPAGAAYQQPEQIVGAPRMISPFMSQEMKFKLQEREFKATKHANEQAMKREQIDLKKEEILQKRDERLYEKTKGYRSQIRQANRDAIDSDFRLNYMGKLDEEGVVPPGAAWVAKQFGLPESLFHPNSEAYSKLSQDFLVGAKSVFGARVTQYEVDLFLKRIPSLLMSKQGRKLVTNVLKTFNNAAHTRSKTMDEVIAANGGKPPLDLEDRVDRRANPAIDKAYKDFIEFSTGAKRKGTQGQRGGVGTVYKTAEEATGYPVGTEADLDGKLVVWNGKTWAPKGV